MKMKNWLKTTLAIGLVAATGTAFVGCGGAAKGDPMSFADGKAAYAKVGEYTTAAVAEADKDAGFTLDFNAYFKDAGSNLNANIDAQFIGSGKKAERVYQFTIDPTVSMGSMMKADLNLKFTGAKYGEKFIFYNEGAKEKLDVTPIKDLLNLMSQAQGEDSPIGSIDLDVDLDTMFSSIVGMLAMNSTTSFNYTEEQFKAQNETNAAIEAAAGASKTIMSAEFLTSGENSYTFKITTERTFWSQKAGTTAATDLDTNVETCVDEFSIADGKVTKISNSNVLKKNGEEKIKMGYSVGIKYEAKKLTAVSADTLKTYKDVVADTSLMEIFLGDISAAIAETSETGNNNQPNNENDQQGGE